MKKSLPLTITATLLSTVQADIIETSKQKFKMLFRNIKLLAAGLFVAVLLTGCGGGDGTSESKITLKGSLPETTRNHLRDVDKRDLGDIGDIGEIIASTIDGKVTEGTVSDNNFSINLLQDTMQFIGFYDKNLSLVSYIGGDGEESIPLKNVDDLTEISLGELRSSGTRLSSDLNSTDLYFITAEEQSFMSRYDDMFLIKSTVDVNKNGVLDTKEKFQYDLSFYKDYFKDITLNDLKNGVDLLNLDDYGRTLIYFKIFGNIDWQLSGLNISLRKGYGSLYNVSSAFTSHFKRVFKTDLYSYFNTQGTYTYTISNGGELDGEYEFKNIPKVDLTSVIHDLFHPEVSISTDSLGNLSSINLSFKKYDKNTSTWINVSNEEMKKFNIFDLEIDIFEDVHNGTGEYYGYFYKKDIVNTSQITLNSYYKKSSRKSTILASDILAIRVSYKNFNSLGTELTYTIK